MNSELLDTRIKELKRVETKWSQDIKFHLNAIGVVTGFMITSLAVIINLQSSAGFGVILTITIVFALISVFLQIFLWLDQISTNREISWQQFNLQINSVIGQQTEGTETGTMCKKDCRMCAERIMSLNVKNTQRGKYLDICVKSSTILIFAIIFAQILFTGHKNISCFEYIFYLF